jgi:hypothetical protein
MKRDLIWLFFVVFNTSFIATTYAQDTLYINRDTTSIANVSFQKAAFNLDTIFQRGNAVLDFPENTLIEFVVANNDTVPHEIMLPDGSASFVLLPSETQLVQITSLPYGTYSVQSLTAQGAFLGAGAILRVGITGISFTWDLWEQDPALTFDFGDGTITVLPSVYRPIVFTMNGGVDPMDMMSSAVITGSVGDTITISIVNNGNMIHPIHFHGYHVELTQSTQQSDRIGWKKDSFPVFVKEGMTLRLIPHQPGEFPVHNHNLVATLFNNGYPLGMITMLMIMP